MSEEKLHKLEINFAMMQTEVKNLKESVEGGFTRLEEKLDKYISAAESKFAGKWVEKVAIASIISLIGALIALVLKQ